MELGRVLYWLRRGQNVSQAQLARELGISKGYLALIENGFREISTSMMEKFVEYYGVPRVLFHFMRDYDELIKEHKPLADCVMAQYPKLKAIVEAIQKEDQEGFHVEPGDTLPLLRKPTKLGIRRHTHKEG